MTDICPVIIKIKQIILKTLIELYKITVEFIFSLQFPVLETFTKKQNKEESVIITSDFTLFSKKEQATFFTAQLGDIAWWGSHLPVFRVGWGVNGVFSALIYGAATVW